MNSTFNSDNYFLRSLATTTYISQHLPIFIISYLDFIYNNISLIIPVTSCYICRDLRTEGEPLPSASCGWRSAGRGLFRGHHQEPDPGGQGPVQHR